jgi:hypothetical protein
MSKVDDLSPEVSALQPKWAILDALMEGTDGMRAAGERLLPKFPNEDVDAYKVRLATATLFPAYQRTAGVMAAKPFSKPLTYGDDVLPKIKEWCEDFDLEGVNFDAFAAEMFLESFSGLAGILIDSPSVSTPDGRPMTEAEQKAVNVRPYGVRIKHNQLRGWRAATVGGKRVLTMLRYAEQVEVEDGEFGTKVIEQIRVLTPGAWATYRKSDGDNKDEWIQYDNGTSALPYITFAPCYGKRKGFMCGSPVLMDLAHLNVKHWQSQSDQDTILHVARVPILAVIGAAEQIGADGKPVPFKLTIGASSAVQLPKGGEIMFVEHTGAAIDAGQKSIEALEDQMIQAGAELMVKKPGARTASESNNDAEANKCDLQRMAETFEDTLDLCLQFMADYAKLGSGGHVTLFKDYGAASLDDASSQLVVDLWQAGGISHDRLVSELKRRGQLDPDTKAEEERQKAQEEGPSLGLLTEPPPPPVKDPAPPAA